jgi:hypothetical protein
MSRSVSLVVMWVVFACSGSELQEPMAQAAGASTGAGSSNGGAAPIGGAGSAGAAAGPAGAASGGAAGAVAAGGAAGTSSAGGRAGEAAAAGAAGAVASGGVAGAVASGGAAGAVASGGAAGDFCAARSGLSFCESFEAHAPGMAQAKPPWAPSIIGEGTLAIDETVAHSGKRSLKVQGAGFSTFFVLSLDGLSSAAAPLYVRTYVRLASAMTAGHNTFVIADTKAAPGAGNAFRLGEMYSMLMYTVMGDTHGALANERYHTDGMPGAALTAGAWGCLEVQLEQQKPLITVKLNGVEIADLRHADFPLDRYDTLRFGFEKYAGPAGDVWYDDIAIGSAPLGCQ